MMVMWLGERQVNLNLSLNLVDVKLVSNKTCLEETLSLYSILNIVIEVIGFYRIGGSTKVHRSKS